MKHFVCVYCEGNDSKFAVFRKEKNGLRLVKTASVDLYKGESTSSQNSAQMDFSDAGGIQLEGIEDGSLIAGGESAPVVEGVVNAELEGVNLAGSDFISILTEPSIYYQVFTKKTSETKSSLTQEILSGSGEIREKKIDRATYGKVELAGGGSLTAYLSQDVPCFNMISRLAAFNKRRNYRIKAVKSAELSLARYVAKKKKFFPDDYSLVVYIGKEYSKLLFMHGRDLKHIGTSLDVGTTNLHTYDVYFSKILLEMENGGIPSLDNVIVCGEDDSENLILSFYGTFPEANVSRLEFDGVNIESLNEDARIKISSYAIPIAVMTEYEDELKKEFTGINLLPKYILEDQKMLQFAWHAYLVVPLIFFLAFYLTYRILDNENEIKKLDKEIEVQTALRNQNIELLSQIEFLDGKINNFDQTVALLDSVSAGSEIWNRSLVSLSALIGQKKNLWLRNLSIEDSVKIKLEGHSLNKRALSDFAAQLDSAIIKNINYDDIRGVDAYRFTLSYKLPRFVMSGKNE